MDSGKIGSEAHRKIKKMQERSSENCQQVSRKVFRRRIRTLEKDGFTLLEVIIALAILGIGLLAILQVFPGAVRSSVRTEYNSRAPLIAQQIMETFKADDEDLRFIRGLPAYIPVPAPPEPIDDDGDGRYSEEFRNGSDDDGDGEFDEDLCEYTVFPPLPFALPPPNQEMYWQLLTTVATDKNDQPLPDFWRVIVRICWYPTGRPYTPRTDPVDGIDNNLNGTVDEDLPFDYRYDLEALIAPKVRRVEIAKEE